MAGRTGAARILIAGGYGTFGRLLARELLATTDARLVIAGRSLERAQAACEALAATGEGIAERVEPLAVDLSDATSLAREANRSFAVVCTAGPFGRIDPAVVPTCVAVGAHWLDIADDVTWLRRLLGNGDLHESAKERGVAVLPGQSSVPAASGALTLWCLGRLARAEAIDVTLWIDNRNAKGQGAVTSALNAGLSAPKEVALPVGRRLAYRFGEGDSTLLEELLGVPADFRVAFEWRVIGWITALTSRLARRLGPEERTRLGSVLANVAAPFGRFGSPGGGIQVEVFGAGGEQVRTSLAGDDQRLAILPCALAVETLLHGKRPLAGVYKPWEWLGTEEMLERLSARGLRWVRR